MKTVCVITGTRAEYGLLKYVMRGIQDAPALRLQIAATGMHLSPEFGLTVREIEQDGFHVDSRVEMLLSSDSPVGIAKSMALGVSGFADALMTLRPDVILLLGDRFEILAAAAAAAFHGIPVAHCHGGEASEGAIDEAIRHSITKLSHLHFVSNEAFRRRVIQLGERPERVFVSGALGVEAIRNLPLYDVEEIEQRLGLRVSEDCLLVTFHPVTLDVASADRQFRELLAAFDRVPRLNLIFTKANADTDGRVINRLIDEYVERNRERSVSSVSLGQTLYLSCMKHVAAVVGNSSSGLLEAPSFRVPSINIGDRQKGRLCAASVINCPPESEAIIRALRLASSKPFRETLKTVVNPYGNGNASEVIVPTLSSFPVEQLAAKDFYDLAFT